MKFPSLGHLLLACLLLISSVLSARAQISFVDMYRFNVLSQTGNGAAGTAYNFSYIGFDLTADAPNQYSTVRVFYPGAGSPISLVNDDPGNAAHYDFTQGNFASQASMDIAYPKGTYSFTANGGGPSATTMVNYANDAYSATQPFLTGTNFSALQGMNSAADFTFQLNPFIKDATATDAFIFFNIFDANTGDVVFGSNFLSSTTTSILMPADTLQSNTAYVYDLDYSDRVAISNLGADFPAILGFDVRTEGYFVTTVPATPAIKITAVSRSAGGVFSVVGKTTPYLNVTLNAGTTPSTQSTYLGAMPANASGVFQISDNSSSGLRLRFYKATTSASACFGPGAPCQTNGQCCSGTCSSGTCP